jgi:hypothetical protein
MKFVGEELLEIGDLSGCMIMIIIKIGLRLNVDV